MKLRPREFEKEKLLRARRKSHLMALFLLLLLLGGVGAVMRDEILVVWYSRQITDPNADRYGIMQKMVDAGPAGARWVINDSRTGSPDGELERTTGEMLKGADYDVESYLMPLFSDPDPRVRAYAVSVAGILKDKRYRDIVAKLTGDGALLPDDWTDRIVSQRAHEALAELEE